MSIAEKADHYRVTERTIYRWEAAGVDTDDTVAVADYLTRIQQPAAPAAERVAELIDNLP